MNRLKQFIKKLLPAVVMNTYYRLLAVVGAWMYGYPSRQLIVVGVTGTKGKSTTSNVLWKLLTDAGHTVGLTSTMNYRIGGQQWLSASKMTMVGRFQLQKLLRQMVKAGCDIAIVETTSEGIKQFRHLGVHYDIGVFTNLTPEHLESHGGFESYKEAKLELFRHIERSPEKVINGKKVQKRSIIHIESEHSVDFLQVGNFAKIAVMTPDSLNTVETVSASAFDTVVVSHIQEGLDGTRFMFNGQPVTTPLLGRWNAMNVSLAMAVGHAFGVSTDQLVTSVATLESVPGRMEFIDEGQPFRVIVDYAHEPVSLGLLYEFSRKFKGKNNRLISLISSTGGGRDVGRRASNGKTAGEYCDYVIVTDEDPYDDDPQEIIDQVAEGVRQAGKEEGKNFWRVLDRREAIKKAIELASLGDVVILTCKGAEQKMCVAGGKKIDWDDRQVARQILHLL